MEDRVPDDIAVQEEPTRATDDFVEIAPDGIAVHPIPLPGIAGLTLAEGRLPVGTFGVHCHRTLEQVTYVLAGRPSVTMRDPATGIVRTFTCAEGDTIATPPLVSLSFANTGPAPVRLLFLCAPPYPSDNADTATLDRHRALAPSELHAALVRLRQVRAESDACLAALEARLLAALAIAGG